MGGKDEGGRDGPRLVGPPAKAPSQEDAGGFKSFMPMVSTSERRKEAIEAFGIYRSRALPAIDEAELALDRTKEDKRGILEFIRIETLVHGKLGECCLAVCGSADPSLYGVFSRVAASASVPSRMIAIGEIARAGYEELVPGLTSLCERCGIEPPPQSADEVIRMHRPAGGG